MKAIWNNQLIAESNETKVVEGNYYFPANAVNKEYLQPSDTNSSCPWKGLASYHSLAVDGKINKDAAWFYPQPKDAAKEIKDHIAFWKGVQITP
jgi:uncharacterized protein (DUF427 family)